MYESEQRREYSEFHPTESCDREVPWADAQEVHLDPPPRHRGGQVGYHQSDPFKQIAPKLQYHFIPNTDSCRAMLGCHDLEGYRYGGSSGKEIYDFNVTVNRLKVCLQKQQNCIEMENVELLKIVIVRDLENILKHLILQNT